MPLLLNGHPPASTRGVLAKLLFLVILSESTIAPEIASGPPQARFRFWPVIHPKGTGVAPTWTRYLGETQLPPVTSTTSMPAHHHLGAPAPSRLPASSLHTHRDNYHSHNHHDERIPITRQFFMDIFGVWRSLLWPETDFRPRSHHLLMEAFAARFA